MPIFTIGIAVAAVVAPMFAVGGIFAAGSIGLFALQLGVGVGLSLLAQKIAGMQEPEEAAAVAAYGIRGRLQGGADLPRSFLLGYRATAGSLVWANTWGGVDTVENKWLTQVIALADYPLPANGLVGLWVNGEKVTIEATAESKGYPITEYRLGKDDNANLWVKFYDGTQTTVDPLCNGDASTGDRDYESTRVGRGVAYVVVTAKVKESLWSGLPTFKFELNGAKLYDISKDSTAGGSGSHVWSNPATWGGDGDFLPVVQIYNLLRGFTYNGVWMYGLQGMTAARLPAANWIAQINKCRASVTGPGGSEPKYRSSIEIPVDSQMADAIEQLLTACQGRLSEIGGFYKIQCGAPDAPVFTLTDAQILSTEEQSFTPFFGLSDTINGITANYPEPQEAWNSKPAPPLYRTDLEVLAGNRRLLADVALDSVPYANQVQRLMLESLQEAQRARRHTIVVGPEFWPAEPGDFLTWTSTRNGYSAKLFRIDGVADKANLDVMLDMTEVDPSDYDYNYSTDYVPPIIGPNDPVRPAPQPIVGFAVSAVEIVGDVAGTKRPGILVEWSVDAVEDLDDVEAIAYEVRLASDDSVVLRGRSDEQEVGSVVVEGNTILPATAYDVRGRYVPSSAREVEWSSWLPVTTTDSFIGMPDLTIELQTYLETTLPDMIIEAGDVDLTELEADVAALQAETAGLTVDVTALETDVATLNSDIAALGTEVDSLEVIVTDNTADIATNASAISTLTGSVATLSTTVSAHTTSINTNTSNIATNTANIATNTSAITTLNGSVSTLSTTVAAHTTSINTNTTNIATNTANIATNASAITTLNGSVSTLSTTVSAHTTSINNLTSDVADNTADIATNASAITTLSGTVSTLSTTVSGHTTSINTNTANIATNTSNIATNASAITTLNGTVTTLSTTVSGHTTSINTLTGDVADNTADIATNASAITTLNGSVATLSTTVSAHTTSIATNTADIATNASAITTLNGTVSTLSTTVSGHTTSINTNTTNIATNTANISTNTSAITTLNGTVSTLSTTVSGHTTSISTLTGDVADNTADIATNASAITTLSGSVSTLSTTVSSHTTSINTLNSNVSTNTADIATNTSAISTLNGSVATLSTTVSAHTTSINTNTANITTNTTAITTLNGYAAAKYSVTLDVNGYATGFSLFNGGTSYSTATFIVDYFRVAKPGTGGGAAIPVFEIGTSSGSAAIVIKGNLISDGSIIARTIAARTITADKVVVGTLTAEEATGAAFTSMSDTIGATVGPALRNKDLIVSLAYTPSALASGNMMFSFDGEMDCKKLDNNPASATWLEMWVDGACTISNATPGSIGYTAHGLVVDQQVRFTTTGTLPSPLVVGTNYFVKTVTNANAFTVTTAIGSAAINTTTNGTGTHKCNARYAQRRCSTNWVESGENNIREGVTWIRRMTVSPGVTHTFSVLVGNGDGSGAFLDFGTDRYNMKVPAIILLESKR